MIATKLKPEVLFIHVPKTGGSSIRSVIAQHPEFNIDVAGTFLPRESFKLRDSYHYTKNKHPSWNEIGGWYNLSDSFIFSVIRNPFDSLLSFYFTRPQHLRLLSFEEYIKGRHSQFCKLSYYVDPEYLNMLLRFEYLQEGFDKLCDLLQVQKVVLPKLRTTSNRPLDYRPFYSSSAKEYVLREFEFELSFYDDYELF